VCGCQTDVCVWLSSAVPRLRLVVVTRVQVASASCLSAWSVRASKSVCGTREEKRKRGRGRRKKKREERGRRRGCCSSVALHCALSLLVSGAVEAVRLVG
jgi:hypothetical protein